MSILNQIKYRKAQLTDKGVKPSLLIMNKEHERELFIDGVISKNDTIEHFCEDVLNIEKVIVVEDNITEIQFYGNYRY